MGINLNKLQSNIIDWIGDILIHKPTVLTLLEFIQSFIELCTEHNINRLSKKWTLFATEIPWCERLIASTGLRYDPRPMLVLLDMEAPITGANHQHGVLHWFEQAIPDFANLIMVLHEFDERIYCLTEKRTKRAVSRDLLAERGWGTNNNMPLKTTNKHWQIRSLLRSVLQRSDFVYKQMRQIYHGLVLAHKYQSITLLGRTRNKKRSASISVGSIWHYPIGLVNNKKTSLCGQEHF